MHGHVYAIINMYFCVMLSYSYVLFIKELSYHIFVSYVHAYQIAGHEDPNPVRKSLIKNKFLGYIKYT